MKKRTKKQFFIRSSGRRVRAWLLDIMCVVCMVVLLVFPFVLRWLGDLFPFVQRVIEMDALAYYGVAFGLFASFITFTNEKRRKDELEERRLKPIITFDIHNVGEMAYVATIANRGSCLLRDIYIDGDYIASDIDAAKDIKINVLLSDCEHNFLNEYEEVCLCNDSGELPRMIIIHCTDIKGQIWAHVFTRFEDYTGIHYSLKEREVDGYEKLM